MNYVECPKIWLGAGTDIALFLGGGITSCPNWQADLTKMLNHRDLTILNPRRACWDASIDPKEQILWEHKHMLRADAITFWFSKATLCPIVLFELGKWLCCPKKLFIGCEPGYARELDVRTQVGLERPFQKVVTALDDLAVEVVDWIADKKADYFVRTKDQPLPKSFSYYDPRWHREQDKAGVGDSTQP